MTATEGRYAQIEKEMLAIVHCCIRFEQFIYGRELITVESDHKPLEIIFKKPIADSSKRYQLMLLYLQKYSLKVTYKKGSLLSIADTLSRAYLNKSAEKILGEVFETEEARLIEKIEAISSLEDVPNNKRRLEEIRAATKIDPTMRRLVAVIREGWPDIKKCVAADLKPYFDVRAELTYEDDLILKGDRLVIPVAQRQVVMANLHSSHFGIEGTLAKAREYVYWPGMNKQVKDMIASCDVCNQVRNQQTKEPLVLQEVPNRAWAVVSADLFELNKNVYLVTVDHYSNYFEYENLTKLSSGMVIRAMKKLFARYGIPEKLITDNGTQFVSADFQTFSKEYGFEHTTSSPRYPQANGKAERAVGVCKRLMEKSLIAKTDFYLALLDFRNTPQAEIGLSPSQRMFGRRTRGILPVVSTQLEPAALPDIQKIINRSTK